MIELKTHERWLIFGSFGVIISTPIMVLFFGYTKETLAIPLVLILMNIIIFIVFDNLYGVAEEINKREAGKRFK